MEKTIPDLRYSFGLLVVLLFAGLLFPPPLQGSARESFRNGQKLFEQSRYEPALQQFEQAVEQSPSEPDFHVALVRTLVKLGRWERARKAAENGLSVDAEAPELQFYMGRIHLAMGDLESALGPFDRALDQESPPGRYYFYRGLTRFRLGDFRGSSWSSARNFRTALEAGFRPAQSRFMLANALLSRGLYLSGDGDSSESEELLRESIHHFRQVLAHNWRASNAFHNMGMAYLGLGELRWAERAVKEAISQEDQVPFFYDTMGMIQFRLGNHRRALEMWNRAQTLDPQYRTHPFASLLSTKSLTEKIKRARNQS